MSRYPDFRIDERWILSQRGEKNPVDPLIPYAWLHEKECCLSGQIEEVATIFLTNRECPYHCLMCDLWKNTLDHPVPKGYIPAQIRYALERMPPAKHLKLYNSGNFFDPQAIPVQDYEAIAKLVDGFDTLIVENHPRGLDDKCLTFNDMIGPRLQVAMGLETVHPEILARLNKRMALTDFSDAVAFLKGNGIQSRAFILLKPPFLTEEEGIRWAKESLDFAFEAGAVACSLLPTMSGNGAMDALERKGFFVPPAIRSLEEVLEYGLALNRGQIFADLWDIELFSDCSRCLAKRKRRLEEMNLWQVVKEPVACICTR
jgi:radical SAM enzyme (TIGR01210 family)